MKLKTNLGFGPLGLVFVSLVVGTALPVWAATYQWDTNGNIIGIGGSGNWVDANWDDMASGVNDGTETPILHTFTTADTAVFGGTAGTVTVASGTAAGTLKFNTTGFTLSGGSIALDTNTWAWGTYSTHDIMIGAGNTVTINSNLTNTTSKDVMISSGISGAGTGAGGVLGGTVVLGGSNTFSNDLYVCGATLEVNNLSALGFASGKGLVLRNWEIGTGNGADASAVSTFRYTGGTATFSNMSGNARQSLVGGGKFVFDITQVGTTLTLDQAMVSNNNRANKIEKTGSGTLTLTGANTYSNTVSGTTGGTIITDGTVAFNNGSLGGSGAITMNGGTLKWNGTNTQDISSRLTMVAGKTARFDTNGNNVTMATAIGGGTTAAFTKTGTGTLTLSGSNNNYTGITTVSAGTLYLSGSLAGSVEVGSDGTITGSGTVGGALTFDAGANLDLSAATLSANGVSTGILTVASGQTMTLNNFSFTDLIGWDYTKAAHGTYTLIHGGGSVNFGGSTPHSIATAYDFGNGNKGYFQQGSLQAVIIPEPGVPLLGGFASIALLRRRRKN